MTKAKTSKTTVDKDESTVVNAPIVGSVKQEAGPTVKVKKTKLKHGPNEPAPVVEPVKVEVKEPIKTEAVVIKTTKSAISKNMMETLNAMKSGKPMTHAQIAAITKREKGNKLRELTELELVTTRDEEGVRGFVYTITKAGLKALTK